MEILLLLLIFSEVNKSNFPRTRVYSKALLLNKRQEALRPDFFVKANGLWRTHKIIVSKD